MRPLTSSHICSPNRKGPVVLVGMPLAYAFPFSYAYLIAYLREHGEQPIFLSRPEHALDVPAFIRKVMELKPLLVGFGNLYPELYPIQELVVKMDAAGRDFPVVVGGQMVTPTPEFAVTVSGADIGVVGEGEIPLLGLVRALRQGSDPAEVGGLILRRGDQCVSTGPGCYIENLSDLPPAAYDVFAPEDWLKVGRHYARIPFSNWHYPDKVVSIHGGRGCPYRCNFCYHHGKTRYRKIEEMMAEADQLLATYDANTLYFGDDLVLASPDRAAKLVAGVRRLRRRVDYSISCRFDILERMDDDLLAEMKATGCRIMGLGIESGSPRILKLMNKRITVEQIRSGMSRLKRVGIVPSVSIQVGQITETSEDVQLSLELMRDTVRENHLANYMFTITTPFPGSTLYDYALEQGLLSGHMDFFERFRPHKDIGGLTVNLSAMQDEEILSWLSQLRQVYLEEKTRACGPALVRMDMLRSWLAFQDLRVRQRFFRNGANAAFDAVYSAPYHLLQHGLDILRRKLYYR